MKLVLDYECTTSNKGNPYDQTNKAVCVGLKQEDKPSVCLFSFEKLETYLAQTTLLIGFNLKFDLAWLRREGFNYDGKLWDCQLAEFILSNQCNTYPSLDSCALSYSLGQKIDIIKTEYWDKGIDTDKIPQEILSAYCIQDIELTYQVYLKQLELFKTTHRHKYKLFLLSMMDTRVLQEMEWNGMYWNEELSYTKSAECKEKLDELRKEILGEYTSLPINLNSGDHLSAFIYGGTITDEYRVPIGVYASGAKIGQPRYKIMRQDYTFERKFDPLPKSELQKEGYFSTDEATLKQLKGSKKQREVLVKLDEFSKLEKLKGTYYDGITKLRKTMNWKPNEIHGQFNQVVARTGRLSASKPNQQNFSPEAKLLFYSRY